MTKNMEETMTIVDIPIDEIFDHPQEPRIVIDDNALEELIKNIKRVKLIHPITVTPRKEGGYYRLAGRRRQKAYRALQWEKIPANVRYGLDDTTIEAILYSENLQRKDLSPMEEAFIFERLLKTKSIEDISAYVNRSIDYLRRRLKLLELEKSVEQALLNEKLTLSLAEQFACLTHEIQKSMLKTVQEQELNAVEFSNLVLAQNDRQLEYAAFDTTACRSCIHNSARQTELFPQATSGLGNCLNMPCWTNKEKERTSDLVTMIEEQGPRGLITNKLKISLKDLPPDVDQTKSVLHQKAELGEANLGDCQSCRYLAVFISGRGALLKQNICTQKTCYEERSKAFRAQNQNEQKDSSHKAALKKADRKHQTIPAVPKIMSPSNAPMRVKDYKRNTYDAFLKTAFTKTNENTLRLSLMAMRHEGWNRGQGDGSILKGTNEQSERSTTISLRLLNRSRDLDIEALCQMFRLMAVPVLKELPLETIEQMIFVDLGITPEDLFSVNRPYLEILTKAEILATGLECDINTFFEGKQKSIKQLSNKSKSDFIKAMTESGYEYPKLPQWLKPETINP